MSGSYFDPPNGYPKFEISTSSLSQKFGLATSGFKKLFLYIRAKQAYLVDISWLREDILVSRKTSILVRFSCAWAVFRVKHTRQTRWARFRYTTVTGRVSVTFRLVSNRSKYVVGCHTRSHKHILYTTNDRSGTAERKAGDKKSGKCATFGCNAGDVQN